MTINNHVVNNYQITKSLAALLVQWLEYAVANGVARVRFPDGACYFATRNIKCSDLLKNSEKRVHVESCSCMQKDDLSPTGLEPALSRFVVSRLIHWATETIADEK